ncbi:ubiquitin-like protein Pup [Rothia nasimurium]|uniref:Prokaryotic ubiquitin-like protein Pup n=1 Tax=Rothia nasimurium TaxID=85336 RepID=A0A4Y9F5N0_9MICC|nr:ubiquitin-like protein Pup [Rothia nasimurium]MBF0807756.1 ubiquitin-like protein Pup [Rothia nasimurium]TFU23106.1 ubiquitin-like protein Pup [Rothia nasimurium]
MDRIQRQNTTSTTSQQVEEIAIAHQNTEVNEQAVSDIDDLLAEIDGVLEENAEDFVKGFVQKGGQ